MCNTVHLQVSQNNVMVTGARGISKTSHNGPSERRTTSLQRTGHLTPIDFTIELIHFEPPRSGHLSTPYERTLMSPRLTLANRKLPPKTDSETTPTIDDIVLYHLCTHQ